MGWIDTLPGPQVAEAVRAWVSSVGVETAEDFCYMFTSQAEAAGIAGAVVAEGWDLMVRGGRQAQSAWGIWQQSRQPVVIPVPQQVPSAEMQSVRLARRKGFLLRTADRRRSNPEAVRMNTVAQELLRLALGWADSRYAREWVGLRPQERESWRKDAIDEIAGMGPIQGRLSAWRTWSAWAVLEGVDPVNARPAELRRYLQRPAASTAHVNAPRSRWTPLDWMRRHMGAPIPTGEVDRPKVRSRTGVDTQAAAMDPELFFAVDQHLARMGADDPLYFYGVIHILLYCVCMRVRHCCRSVLTKLGSKLLTGVCIKGKRQPGWEWRVPRYAPSGLDVGGIIWGSYQQYCASEGLTEALVGAFVHPVGGVPLEYDDVLAGCRSFLQEAAGPAAAKTWTTYSSRRAIPTIMDLLEFPDPKRRAAGNWPDAKTNMPVRYSGARVATAAMARAEAIESIITAKRRVPGKLTWDALAGAKHSIDWRVVQKKAAAIVAENEVISVTPTGLLAGIIPEAPAFDLSQVSTASRPKVGVAPRRTGADPVAALLPIAAGPKMKPRSHKKGVPGTDPMRGGSPPGKGPRARAPVSRHRGEGPEGGPR